MTNLMKGNMLNTNHPLQKRRVIHPLPASQYAKVLTHHFHQHLQRRTLTQRKEEFYGRKRIFTSQILHDPSHAEAVTASDDSGPCALLAKYFSHDVFTLLAEETNLRYFTKERRQLKVTPSGMRKFMGICILMGNLNYPRLRMYWQTSYLVPGIADVMTQKRFLTIFANLAATSNQERPR